MPTENGSQTKSGFLSRFKLQKIDQYLLIEIAGPFLGGLLFLLFIFLMFQVLRLAESLIVHGVPFLVLLKILWNLSIAILVIALPMALLLGVLNAFTRLSSDSELVAMKACGIGLGRLARWPVILAIAVSLLCLLLNLEIAPKAEQDTKRLLVKVANTKVVSSIKEGTFTTGFFDLLVYADKADPKTNKMEKVFIFDERQPKNPMTIISDKGEIIPIETQTELGSSIVFHLENGSIHRNEFESDAYQKIDFGSYLLFLKVIEGDDASALRPKMLRTRDLVRKMRSEPTGIGVRNDYETELWRRFWMSLIALPFALVSIGLGSVRTRATRAGPTVLSLGVIVSFWILMTLSLALAKKAWIPPILVTSLPCLIMGWYGIRSFKQASW